MTKHVKRILSILAIILPVTWIQSKHFIIISAPGSGKGTFCQYMVHQYGYVHVGSGDIFRKYLDNNQPLTSKLLRKVLESMIKKSLSQGQQFILDNAISSKKSWQDWKYFFSKERLNNDIVCIVLEASDETCINRIKHRLICKQCHHVYKTKTTRILQNQKCSECGTLLSIRKEDTNDAFIKKRFKRYHEEINPIIDLIEQSYQVIKISSEQDLETLYSTYDQLNNL